MVIWLALTLALSPGERGEQSHVAPDSMINSPTTAGWSSESKMNEW